ncbi:MAG: AAA family ATPase, partial [Pseudomonadota bacterium]|nr:AAA family ATPase [Pseudomonadota bacterium]
MTGVVITGGPGSGKTSLIEALANLGNGVEPEAGRAIIRRQQSVNGPALPWRDRTLFAQRMFEHDIEAHDRSRLADGVVFHDRGLPDVIGYLTLCGLQVPDHMSEAARTLRYHATVFIAPLWPERFGQEADRRKDFN